MNSKCRRFKLRPPLTMFWGSRGGVAVFICSEDSVKDSGIQSMRIQKLVLEDSGFSFRGFSFRGQRIQDSV